MSPAAAGFEQAFAQALDDLRQDRLADPESYLSMVPRTRHDEFVDRLTAAMADAPPTAAAAGDGVAEAQARAAAAVAAARASGGPAGILPGALVALRRARGIERDDVLDHLAAEFELGESARPTLRRLYHGLESGTLLGSNVSHRLLASLARRFGARVEDFVAAIQPTGGAGRGAMAPMMARGAGDDGGGGRSAGAAPSRTARATPPDPDAELARRLFTGGPDA
ncbi:hypothetical protein [Baekduia sp. Peel2402]|uniref:hypothetical protein n=1 Tax=Baekduia sp. Peel2402 TaxID=3458296 RepID=UPI00403ED641